MNEIFYYYYASLSAAVADLNNEDFSNALSDGVNASDAAVEVKVSGEQTTLKLLTAVTEGNDLLVNKSMKLVLGGKTLTLSGTACLNFGQGTDCIVDGIAPGSTIRCDARGTASLILGNGNSLKIYGGHYEGATLGDVAGITLRINTGKAVLKGCTLTHDNTGASGRGVAVFVAAPARAVLENCKITANATHAADVTNATNAAFAVMVAGGLNMKGGTVTADSKSDQSTALVVNIGSKAEVNGTRLDAVSENGGVYTVQNMGELTLRDAVVEAENDGEAANLLCTGLYNTAGSALTVVDTTVASETASAKAQALWNLGQAEITDCALSATGGNGNADAVWNQADADMQLSGSTVIAESDLGVAVSISTYQNSNTDIRCCKISANTNSESSTGINNEGAMTVTHSVVTADAPNEEAYGLKNYDRCILIDTDVEGIHSGCLNDAHLYVRGGTFTGWTHGGLYMCPGDLPNAESGKTGEGYLNYINDAVLRCGYFGRHAEEIKATGQFFGACGYIGSGKNITGYLDGCTFDGTVMVNFDLEEYRDAYAAANPDKDPIQIAPHAMSFRSSLGETDNTLYISNSQIYDCRFRIDGRGETDLGHRLYVGGCTNITEESVNNTDNTIFNGTDSYRQSEAWFRAQVM